MAKQTFYIKGMHCSSCEILIEKKSIELNSVKSAHVSLSKNILSVESENDLSTDKLNNLFKDDGYSFSNQPFKEEKSSLVGPIIAGIIAIIIFILINKLGLTSIININSNSSLPAFFVLGIIAGVSSCAALVGGLILSLSKQWASVYATSETFIEKSKPHILFNIGRLISFTFLGLILGFIGEKIQLTSWISTILIIAISIIMLILALQMLGIKSLNKLRFSLPKGLASRALDNSKVNGIFVPFFIGFLTFLIPCGFTLMAEGIAILSGNPLRGAMIMLLFALGTMIPLLAIGFSSTKLINNLKLSDKFMKAAGILIIFFVAYNIYFTFNLSQYLGNDNSDNNANITQSQTQTQNVQEITTTYTLKNDITPNTFTVKKGQSVKFIVDAQDDGSGCMSTIMIQDLYPHPQTLHKGQQITMEFTPTEAGTYLITCAMNVPRGKIIVTE